MGSAGPGGLDARPLVQCDPFPGNRGGRSPRVFQGWMQLGHRHAGSGGSWVPPVRARRSYPALGRPESSTGRGPQGAGAGLPAGAVAARLPAASAREHQPQGSVPLPSGVLGHPGAAPRPMREPLGSALGSAHGWAAWLGRPTLPLVGLLTELGRPRAHSFGPCRVAQGLECDRGPPDWTVSATRSGPGHPLAPSSDSCGPPCFTHQRFLGWSQRSTPGPSSGSKRARPHSVTPRAGRGPPSLAAREPSSLTDSNGDEAEPYRGGNHVR